LKTDPHDLPAVSLAGPWFDFLILGRVGMGLFERLHYNP
jgi:hypothetical protein